jgi:hypothetical protein
VKWCSRITVLRSLGLMLGIVIIVGRSGLGAAADTPNQFVALGHRIHGEFGSLIALGIRIGIDATSRLHDRGRRLRVVYQSGPAAPCPCVVDGVMLATGTSPGQNSLHVGSPSTDSTVFGVVTVTDVRHGAVRYIIPAATEALMGRINRLLSERARYDAVMSIAQNRLFRVSAVRE